MPKINIIYAFAAFLICAVILPTVDHYLISGGFGIVGKIGATLAALIVGYFVGVAVFGKK